MHSATARLALHRPRAADVDELYSICSDPRSWTHYPSLRHSDVATTRRMLDGWVAQWDRDGLGIWIVRAHDGDEVLGYGGCSFRQDRFWNLGYRLAPEHHGNGYATEISFEAIGQARRLRPEVPVVAYLLEHNRASARVAEKLGFIVVDRLPDKGNPDPEAVRVVYADRLLSVAQREAVAAA